MDGWMVGKREIGKWTNPDIIKTRKIKRINGKWTRKETASVQIRPMQ
jgi:hypothetical protein